ncbi:MAG: DUF177 domain-containing protein [Acidobacteriota bacterium]
MEIVVADLPAGGQCFEGETAVDLGSDADASDVVVSRSVSYGLRATRDGSTLQVRGWLATDVEATCFRCLEKFRFAVRPRFELTYKPATEEMGDEERVLDEKDLDLDDYQGGAVDLRDLLVEQVLLALPMKALCRPDCVGLCPACGCNRNRNSCSCDPDVDSRLAPLSAIRDRL